MPAKSFTDAELDALPMAQGLFDRHRVVTDPQTGETRYERLPVQFLVNDTEIYSFTDGRGDSWTVGRTADGHYFKSRVRI